MTLQADPAWYIARCQPSQEARAAAGLAARRFGVYLPELQTWRSVKHWHVKRKQWVGSREVAASEVMFPGYVLLWVCGLAAHYRLIRTTRGVSGFLLNGAGEPAIVPYAVVQEIGRAEHSAYVQALPRSLLRRRGANRPEIGVQAIPRTNYGWGASAIQRTGALHTALQIAMV